MVDIVYFWQWIYFIWYNTRQFGYYSEQFKYCQKIHQLYFTILPITITLHFRRFKFIYCSSHHFSIFLILHWRILWDTSVTEDLSIRLKQFEHTCIKVGLYSGWDSDATDLRCRFQHRYPIAATTHVIADHR